VGDDVRGPSVTFCLGLGQGFKDTLLTKLTGHQLGRDPRDSPDGRAK
jgi:hypothetical protein